MIFRHIKCFHRSKSKLQICYKQNLKPIIAHTESTALILKAFNRNPLPNLQFPSADTHSTPNNDNLEAFLGRPPFVRCSGHFCSKTNKTRFGRISSVVSALTLLACGVAQGLARCPAVGQARVGSQPDPYPRLSRCRRKFSSGEIPSR